MSKAPLELIFFYVWGPAPNSINKNNYYVTFIDDYSTFTWIFLLKINPKYLLSSMIFNIMLKDS
jgi:hypothetical protein